MSCLTRDAMRREAAAERAGSRRAFVPDTAPAFRGGFYLMRHGFPRSGRSRSDFDAGGRSRASRRARYVEIREAPLALPDACAHVAARRASAARFGRRRFLPGWRAPRRDALAPGHIALGQPFRSAGARCVRPRPGFHPLP
ncbi:hypothetical protein T210_0129980 [Burkholderia pseudomallei MSHR6137]|nr:hypothetical protein T210_0129980 [Burkholderia pseudomallei MSHR6137]